MRWAPVVLSLTLAVGCGGKSKDKTPPTDTGPSGDALQVTCTQAGIELRFECVVVTPVDERSTVRYSLLVIGPDPSEQ